MTVNNLPDEVILEIFDYYRRSINSYDHQWRENYAWFNLAHVCRKWRAVTFASATRLDLGITVGPTKPAHIKTILSGPFPIHLDYELVPEDGNITHSSIWRMRTVLRLRDRVRGIAFAGGASKASLNNLNKFFKATNCSFPVLESLVLRFSAGYERNIPETFLRGPDLSDLRLRRLELIGVSFPSISKFLLSATSPSLTDLLIDFKSSGTSLLACLKGMSRLRSLSLFIPSSPYFSSQDPSPQPATRVKGVALLSKLTRFCYVGSSVFLNALAAGLSAPSLRDVNIEFRDHTIPSRSLVVHLPRFFNEIEEHYHAVHVAILEEVGTLKLICRLSLLTQPEYIGHCKPRFELGPYSGHSSESITRLIDTLSTRLTTVEALRISFDSTVVQSTTRIPWRRLYQQFPGVKTLQPEGTNSTHSIVRTVLHQVPGEPNDLPLLPSLEEIDLGTAPVYESQRKSQLAVLQPFVHARQKAGCPVKVFFGQ